ncbi:MAG: amidohydrolase family protein [Pseudomonadota bacterium]
MKTGRHLLSLLAILGLVSCGPAAKPVDGELLITSALIVVPETGEVSDPSDILISDGRIARITAAGENETTGGIETIDAAGLYLLPGLIDAHAHIGDGGLEENSEQDRRQALAQFVRYGVTSIFVPGGGGGNDAQLRDWKAFCAAGTGRCPRLFGSGSLVTAYGSHPITTIWGLPADADPKLIEARGAVGITEEQSVDRLIREKLLAKVDALKIVVEDGPGGFAPKPRLSRAKVAEICTAAHAGGLRVYAHISLAEHVVDVVDGGCDGIMHAPDDVIPDDTLREMAERKVYYVATLSLFDALMDQGAGRRTQDDYALAGVSPKALESLRNDEYWATAPESPEVIAEWQHALGWNLRRAAELGVPIALGTDTNNPQVFPGYAVHEELELMVEAGLTEAEALESATVTAAGFLQREDELGRIRPGYRADIVALRDNPLEGIRNTRSIEFVLTGGVKKSDVVSMP